MSGALHVHVSLVPVWVIYQRPKDYPRKFVARLWNLDEPTATALVADTLEEVRGLLPAGLVRIERNPLDDPVILEAWV